LFKSAEDIEIETIGSGNNIEIYPNPANINVNIVFPWDVEYLVEIFDLNGKVIKSMNFKERIVNFECSNLSS